MSSKIFLKIVILVFFLACLSAGNINSRNSNGFDDTVTLNIYNGAVSENFQIFEISRYFDQRCPIKYTLKINFYSKKSLFINQVYIEADRNRFLLKKPIFSKRKKIDNSHTEILLFVFKGEQIKKIALSENIFIEFRGQKGNASFVLLESHKIILKEFYKKIMSI